MRKLFRKPRNKLIKSQKGVALLWSLITIGVLLTITGSMASLVVKESRMSVGIDASVMAYAAAESGIEHGESIYKSATYPFTPIEVNVGSINGLKYKLEIEKIDNDNYTISSTGKSGNTTRKIEKKIDKGADLQPFIRSYDVDPNLAGGEHSINWLDDGDDPSEPNNIETPVQGSYTQLFMIDRGTPTGQFFAIGLAESEYDATLTASAKKIMLVQQGGNLGFFSGDKSVGTYTSLDGVIATPLTDTSKDYYIEINYIKNVAVQAKVREGSRTGRCVGIIPAPINGDFKLWKVRFEGTSISYAAPPTSRVKIDGDNVKVRYMGIKAKAGVNGSEPTPTPPIAPALSAPSSGAAGISYSSATLSWVASSGAESYRVQLDEDITFGSPFKDLSGITGTTTTVTNLFGSQIYYWKVGATNVSGITWSSPIRSFTTAADPSWYVGKVGTLLEGKRVYVSDTASLNWKTTSTDCDPPQCGVAGGQDGDNLVAGNSADIFSLYPARNACKAIGGRLPTIQELLDMWANKTSYGTFFGAYWSSTEISTSNARWVNISTGLSSNGPKTQNYKSRCIK